MGDYRMAVEIAKAKSIPIKVTVRIERDGVEFTRTIEAAWPDGVRGAAASATEACAAGVLRWVERYGYSASASVITDVIKYCRAPATDRLSSLPTSSSCWRAPARTQRVLARRAR